MKAFVAATLILLAEVARAAAGEHGEGIPTKEIFWQIFNLSILLGALTYFLRQPVKNYFAQRRAGFLSAAEKSQTARKQAEAQYLEIKRTLDRLESTREESLQRAQAEAADLRKQMIKDAEEMAARIRKEAETTAAVEVARARAELHTQFVQDAVAGAREVLTKDIGGQDQQKLQADFLKNIQSVNP